MNNEVAKHLLGDSMEYLVVVLRGLPGAGKSDFAKFIAGEKGSDIICEADDYHYNDEGVYEFDPSNLKQAHQTCFNKFTSLINIQEPLIIVSNTSTTIEEFFKYNKLALEHGYRVVVTTVENYRDGKSIHDVPDEALDRMRQRFQINL